MGEEEKKPDEKKVEEKKDGEEKKPEEEKKEEPKDEKPKEENKETKTEDAKEEPKEPPPPPPPPPEEIVLRVYMHCEGCAKKVKKSLRGFEGVEDVHTDCRTRTVVVKGKKAAADPLKVLDRVQRKSHRQVELISPIPKPPEEDAKKDEEKKENAKTEEKKEEPQVIIVVLKVYMHCEACAQEIRKRIQKMKGVESADPDLKSSLVTVKGVFDPAKLVEYVYKRTGKRAEIVKQEPEKKEENKEEKKSEGEEKAEKGGEGGEKKEEKEEKKEEEKGEAKPKEEGEGEKGGEAAAAAAAEAGEEATKVELKKNEFLYYYPIPRYPVEYYAYPPQIFSDENPNACSVM